VSTSRAIVALHSISAKLFCRFAKVSYLQFVANGANLSGRIKTGRANFDEKGLSRSFLVEVASQGRKPMEQPVEEITSAEPKPDYNLHIKVPAEMRPILRDAAQLAHKMGDIPKPERVDLMNLFIGWGLTIKKKKWLDRVGYR